ncbi:MAG: hypothetical protein ACT4PE_17045 [Candidatus Eiseniibacteriota bacterium]
MKRHATRIALGAAVLVFVVASWRFAPFTAEDAYITALHARNLVESGTLSFNTGEHVSALTSPLHALLEAALHAVTKAIVPANKALSLAAMLVAAWIALRRTTPTSGARLGWATVVIASPAVILWTWGGLETPYLFLLATLLAERTLAPEPWNARRMAVVHLTAGLMFLTRHDAAFFAAPLVVHSWSRVRRIVPILGTVLLGAAAPAAWLLFAKHTYGEILPTSAYLKAPVYSVPMLTKNGLYVAAWLVASGVIPLAVAALVGKLRRRNGAADAPVLARPSLEAVAVLAGLLATLVYSMGMATTHMMFGFRFFVPFLGVMVLLLTRLSGADRSLPRPAFLGTAVALLLFQVVHVIEFDRRSLNGLVPIGEYRAVGVRSYSRQFVPALLQAGEALRLHWAARDPRPSRPPRLVSFAGGAPPFAAHAYVYEQLASYRHNWSVSLGWMRVHGKSNAGPDGLIPERRVFDAASAADYLLVLTPRHGPVEAQIPGPPEAFELVWRADLEFEGQREVLLLLHSPHPAPQGLPPYVSGLFEAP